MMAWILANWHTIVFALLTVVVKVPFVEHSTIIEALISAALGIITPGGDDPPSDGPSQATQFKK